MKKPKPRLKTRVMLLILRVTLEYSSTHRWLTYKHGGTIPIRNNCGGAPVLGIIKAETGCAILFRFKTRRSSYHQSQCGNLYWRMFLPAYRYDGIWSIGDDAGMSVVLGEVSELWFMLYILIWIIPIRSDVVDDNFVCRRMYPYFHLGCLHFRRLHRRRDLTCLSF